MTLAYLCLGGNVGDARATLALACGTLARAGLAIRATSPLYETPPWGPVPQPAFLNQVIAVESPCPPRSLLYLALLVELMLGRDRARETRFGPRRIDIDILLFGDEAVSEPGLELPHPRLLERAFALVPLADIAPDLMVAGTPVRAALARLDTSGIVRKD